MEQGRFGIGMEEWETGSEDEDCDSDFVFVMRESGGASWVESAVRWAESVMWVESVM